MEIQVSEVSLPILSATGTNEVPTELIAPTLQEIGEAVFGRAWREVLAYEFEVAEEDIMAWEVDASKRPPDIETRVRVLAAGQIEQIQILLGHMEVTGLRKVEK